MNPHSIKYFFIEEEIPKIKWKIKELFKEFNGIKCQKASGYFRGRTYTVWFALDIPVPYGPWKLQGLPGIILEAIDEKQEIYFKVKRVQLGGEVSFEIPETKQPTKLRVYISEIIPNEYKELMAVIMSRNPDRNTTITEIKDVRETNLEVIYEWEEENKKR